MSQPERIEIPDYFPVDVPRFAPGSVVRHRRYGYRGVVVDFDLSCRADEQWYESNQSKPDRDQAWYHILVDGSEICTYAAESNLQPDGSAEPITHELVGHFFEDYADGRYTRNDEIWPGWE
ncbi:heat shock protein HspQ [Mucisphaera calidilacus]|uniref:Heat shock protein HspQ n=1 Tax=Mucisphaera calidilacus TaxID=2527982 RepID=A0A518BYC8_9BACT|nr:heat shock protein HspQ [Mucisphaera calidilacus]QDU71964.1 Heat shock protein HspQ [Mucisphaera calidilacus]